jgi:outer membrane protein assembly factor BamB
VQSGRGEFRCLDLANGKIIWGTSFEKDFGVKFLGHKAKEGTAARRGNNGTAVVDGEDVIVPVGSTDGATLVCFNKLNGKIIWKSGNEEAAYSSPQVATLAGVKQVVYLSADSLSGFDRTSGKILWHVPLQTNAKRHAATPVIFENTVIVNSHTFGLISTKIIRDGMEMKAQQAWVNANLLINLSTPVRVGNYLYSQGPDKDYICADVRDGGRKWEAPGFGIQNSSTIVVGKNLLVLTDRGELVLLAPDAQTFKTLGRTQACGKNWNFPALSGSRLFVRDARELICYELIP